MNFAIFIGQRLSLKSKTKRGSSGTSVAVTGISLAVSVMLLSIAIVTGFKHEIRNKVEGFESQLSIYPEKKYATGNREYGIRLTDSLKKSIFSTIPEARIGLSLKQPCILKTDSAFQGIVMKGIANGHDTEFIASSMKEGRLPEQNKSPEIALSSLMASMLNLSVGDKVYAHFLENDNLRTRNMEIVGIYDTHFNEYDKLYAYVSLPFAQKLNRVDSITGTSISIDGLEQEKINDAWMELNTALLSDESLRGRSYRVDSVLHTGAIYFNWLDLLDTNVIVILILMGLVSGFTLISSLFIIILERVNTIGLLKAIGASNNTVRAIFIYMAQRIMMRGLLIGNAIGLAIIIAQKYFRVLPLDPEAYYLNYVPVEIDWLQIVLLNLAVILISCIVLIVPSHIVCGISPAKTMRYE